MHRFAGTGPFLINRRKQWLTSSPRRSASSPPRSARKRNQRRQERAEDRRPSRSRDAVAAGNGEDAYANAQRGLPSARQGRLQGRHPQEPGLPTASAGVMRSRQHRGDRGRHRCCAEARRRRLLPPRVAPRRPPLRLPSKEAYKAADCREGKAPREATLKAEKKAARAKARRPLRPRLKPLPPRLPRPPRSKSSTINAGPQRGVTLLKRARGSGPFPL